MVSNIHLVQTLQDVCIVLEARGMDFTPFWRKYIFYFGAALLLGTSLEQTLQHMKSSCCQNWQSWN